VVTLVGGTMFLMWLGEQITARGIGNGTSLIIFVGIVAEIPAALAQFFSQGRAGVISTPVIIGVLVMVVAVIAAVVFMERALRKIHIQYPRRQVGMKIFDGGSSHLPIKVNPAGVIPAIFASSLLLLPTTIATFSGLVWSSLCFSCDSRYLVVAGGRKHRVSVYETGSWRLRCQTPPMPARIHAMVIQGPTGSPPCFTVYMGDARGAIRT